jgi:hypothetical protein
MSNDSLAADTLAARDLNQVADYPAIGQPPSVVVCQYVTVGVWSDTIATCVRSVTANVGADDAFPFPCESEVTSVIAHRARRRPCMAMRTATQEWE